MEPNVTAEGEGDRMTKTWTVWASLAKRERLHIIAQVFDVTRNVRSEYARLDHIGPVVLSQSCSGLLTVPLLTIKTWL
jgi:hypothetical protein